MVQIFKFERLIVVGLIVCFSVVPGCALFPSTDRIGSQDNSNFHRSASSASNPVPLPVEIVNDISMIASGFGNPQEGKWNRVPSQAVTPEIAPTPIPTPIPAAIPEPAPIAMENVKAQKSNESPSRERPSREGQTEKYTVQTGDTLMKISFEKFGNIYRWREIYKQNQDLIPDYNNLKSGTVLTIAGVEYVVITRNGVPYLIRRGDTLVKIAGKVYGVSSKWRSIWKNNPELIKDPNKIYAGFTLYYSPEDRVNPGKSMKQFSQRPKPPTVDPSGHKSPASVPNQSDSRLVQPKEHQQNSESKWVPAQ